MLRAKEERFILCSNFVWLRPFEHQIGTGEMEEQEEK
jgi:hypothetical protein